MGDFAFARDGKLLAFDDRRARTRPATAFSFGTWRGARFLCSTAASAVYERLTWTEKGDGLTVLKGTDDRRLRDRLYSVIGFTGFSAGSPQKTVYDPASDKSFPQGMTISPQPRSGVDRGFRGA